VLLIGQRYDVTVSREHRVARWCFHPGVNWSNQSYSYSLPISGSQSEQHPIRVTGNQIRAARVFKIMDGGTFRLDKSWRFHELQECAVEMPQYWDAKDRNQMAMYYFCSFSFQCELLTDRLEKQFFVLQKSIVVLINILPIYVFFFFNVTVKLTAKKLNLARQSSWLSEFRQKWF